MKWNVGAACHSVALMFFGLCQEVFTSSLSVLMCHQLYPSSNAQKSLSLETATLILFSLFNMHVWSCKKVSYYPNIIFLTIWHFGLTCRSTKVFQENGLFWCKSHFVYTMKIHKFERTFYSEEICSQHHTIWSSEKYTVPSWCLHHITHYEVRTTTQCVHESLNWYVQLGCLTVSYGHFTLLDICHYRIKIHVLIFDFLKLWLPWGLVYKVISFRDLIFA